MLITTLIVVTNASATTLHHITRTIYLGNTPIQIIKYNHGPGKTFIHVHHDEITAKNAALSYIKKHGGHLITLNHPGKRNIEFTLHHRHYEFDPNRIFTRRGRLNTLEQNSHYSLAAATVLKKLADKLLNLLPSRGKIIAVHNNKTSYSLLEYAPHQSLAKDARRFYHAPHQSVRNFYIVTQGSDFYRLKQYQKNVVLQAKHATDDGSLSIRLAHRRYFNVEAAYGALKVQKHLLRLI